MMPEINLSTIKNMATMLGVKFPEAQPPMNSISEFIDREIDLLLPPNADPEIVDVLKGVYINLTNKDPNNALKTLIRIHGDIGELVRELQMEQYIDEHPPVEDVLPEPEDVPTEDWDDETSEE